MCREFHVLPGPGALLDQDSLFVYGMNMVIEAQDEKNRLDDMERTNKAKRSSG